MDGSVQPTPLVDVLIDETTWRCATGSRQAEWLQAIAELIEESAFFIEPDGAGSSGQPPELHGRIVVTADAVRLDLYDPHGVRVGSMEILQPVLAPVLRDYLQTLQAFDGGPFSDASPQFEAMDIARRLLHDDAAELVQRSCVGARPDHKTARRLFTLLVLLTHDPAKLSQPSAWTA